MCYQCDDYEYLKPCPDQFPGCRGECYGFDCLACGSSTLHLNEYYMVTDEVWEIANPDKRGMLCIGCLEDRVGRLLTKDDFTDAPVNSPGLMMQSARLLNRLTGMPQEQLQQIINELMSTAAGSIPTSDE